QPQLRPHFGPGDGCRARGDLQVLGVAAWRRSSLRRLCHPLQSGALGAVAAPLAQDAALRSDPARAGILDSLFPHRARSPDARRRFLLRRRLWLLLRRPIFVLRYASAERLASADRVGGRLGARHDRAVVLAATQTLVPALAADPLRVRAVAADFGD